MNDVSETGLGGRRDADPRAKRPAGEPDGRGGEDQSAERPAEIARRAVLRRGAKLIYIVPAVLAAMTAKPAFAFS